MALQLLWLSMSGTRTRCRELLSGDYSSLLVYASLVGAAAVSWKTVCVGVKTGGSRVGGPELCV